MCMMVIESIMISSHNNMILKAWEHSIVAHFFKPNVPRPVSDLIASKGIIHTMVFEIF